MRYSHMDLVNSTPFLHFAFFRGSRWVYFHNKYCA